VAFSAHCSARQPNTIQQLPAGALRAGAAAVPSQSLGCTPGTHAERSFAAGHALRAGERPLAREWPSPASRSTLAFAEAGAAQDGAVTRHWSTRRRLQPSVRAPRPPRDDDRGSDENGVVPDSSTERLCSEVGVTDRSCCGAQHPRLASSHSCSRAACLPARAVRSWPTYLAGASAIGHKRLRQIAAAVAASSSSRQGAVRVRPRPIRGRDERFARNAPDAANNRAEIRLHDNHLSR
jgi:hypothetical protein